MLDAAEAFIKEPGRLGLHSRLAAVAYVGRSFRSAISLPDEMDDIQASCRSLRATCAVMCPQLSGCCGLCAAQLLLSHQPARREG